ncbi:putative acetyltransferase [Thermosporothrix hazakensis]|jgi:predicted acetyltransferase|uniref:Putative acetyltransferase n=1 Tax=Thermosporothrix hazakensis TaxID=644383 RepID=A0A326U360_THEHA|nr:GNAT family N-acetyltransferase [Thermosporothrix hazakensis]PZW26353.1 putative acetyltransferase [Thermosporothrix hazakensis]GCE48696.1 GNAT family N-acetyltransferase [Thermosporothrix hazakensis]
MLFLTEPSMQYKDQYIAAIREFQKEGRHLYNSIQTLNNNFAGFLQKLEAQRNIRPYPPDQVPSTDLWLIDDNEFIGRLSIRPVLNDFYLKLGGHIGYEIRPSKRCQGYGKEILRLGLQEAKKLGLARVLITCDVNNIGSKKVIEANGGQFENIVSVEGSMIPKLRYWIDLG